MTAGGRRLAGLVVAAGLVCLLALAGCDAAAGRPAAGRSAGAAASASPAAGGRRLPVRESWEIQLASPPEAPYPDVGLIEVDGFDTPAATVAALHRTRAGRVVVCYVDAGTWESWRPDAARYPTALLGKPDNGWAGERWVDIARYRGTLSAILQARVRMCRAKGFEAVDFDNVDGYQNDTGFDLTAGGQLAFDRSLAGMAHRAGLLVALKNDAAQLPQLLPYFDFGVDEQCYQDGGCGLGRFVAAGKPAFDIEYQPPASRFCPAANRQDVNALLKHLSLDDWRVACR